MANNDDQISIISDDRPIIFMITLPDGCDPGKPEAVKSFAESLKVLKREYRRYNFNFIPFSYDQSGGLKSIMAIER